MRELRDYYVTARIRGTQTMRVVARSKREAADVVRRWSSGDLDPTEWDGRIPDMGEQVDSVITSILSIEEGGV